MSAAEPSLVPHIWAAGTDGDTAYLVRDVSSDGGLTGRSRIGWRWDGCPMLASAS